MKLEDVDCNVIEAVGKELSEFSTTEGTRQGKKFWELLLPFLSTNVSMKEKKKISKNEIEQ